MSASAKFDRMRRHIVALSVWVMACGCGGELVEDPAGGGGGGLGGQGAAGSGASPASNGGSAASSTGKTRLGTCVPGTPQAKVSSCQWFASEICYPTKEAACNCVCPINVAEVYCMSDFAAVGTPTEVYCY